MPAREERTLEITGRFRDLMSKGFAKVRLGLKTTVAAFRRGFKALTAPIRVPLKAISSLTSKLLSLRNIVVGFIAIQAGRRAFGFLQQIADDLDEIVKTSDRLQATTESLSQLRFVGELAAIQFSEITAALTIFSRNLESARSGTEEQARAFRDLGINIEEVAKLTKIDLIDLLATASEGFNRLGSATERNNALLVVFGRSGSKLGPLLAGGAEQIRELADEAERLGVVFDRETLERAAQFNDALTRLRTSFRGVFQTLFLDAAPKISAIFTKLSQLVSENRGAIIAAIQSIGEFFLFTLDKIVDGVIGLIEAIESIPGVSLADEKDLRRELTLLNRQLDTIERTGRELRKQQREIRRAERAGGRRGEELSGLAVADIRRGVSRLPQELQDAFIDFLVERGRVQARINALQTGLDEGLAGILRQQKGSLVGELRQLARELGGAAVDSGRQVGNLFGKGFGEGFEGEGGTAGGGTARAGAVRERQLIQLQQTLLNLAKPTEDVQIRMAQLNAELARVDVGDKAIQFLQDGTIKAEDLAGALRLLDGNAQRALNAIGIDGARKLAQFDEALIRTLEPTRAVELQLLGIDDELQKLDFESAFNDGRISAEQLVVALASVDDATAATASRIRGDFAQGFEDGARRALRAFTDLTDFAEKAAGQLINQGLTGLTDGLTDVITRVKSAKDAFREFATSTLRLVARLIVQFTLLKLLGGATGGLNFEQGGVMPGKMRSMRSRRRFGFGGIARSPQLAIFGEGRGAEAFVPLPDGRRIPVVMSGGGGGGLTIIVQTIDAKDTARWFTENRGLLYSIHRHGLDTSTGLRQATQRAAG